MNSNGIIKDPTTSKQAAVIAGANTGVNGLRVYIGATDPVSDLPVFVTYEHHQRHEGETHQAQDLQETLATSTVKYGLTVPTFATTIQSPHLLIQVDCYAGAVRVDIYEGATFTGGSTLTPANQNRNSATVPGMTIKTGVTSTNGTQLPMSMYFGTASNIGARESTEIILKSNTIYRVDVVGKVAGTDALVRFIWYEDLGV